MSRSPAAARSRAARRLPNTSSLAWWAKSVSPVRNRSRAASQNGWSSGYLTNTMNEASSIHRSCSPFSQVSGPGTGGASPGTTTGAVSPPAFLAQGGSASASGRAGGKITHAAPP
ncbi:hypothetical protein GCM10010182_28040 [Actinomadura cremea]|nr:hypothetical protein GCM10010182_28040 [Actinomadura cremea]